MVTPMLQVFGKINKEGIFLEKLETNPAKFLPETEINELDEKIIEIDLNKNMNEILSQLNNCKVKTRINLSGPLIVARDIAHAKMLDQLDEGDIRHGRTKGE